MNTFRVYKHPLGTIEAIKEGWSWPAFFLGFIWAYVKKLHLIATVTLILGIIFTFIFGLDEKGMFIQNILTITFAAIYGIGGNKWREGNLQERGFEVVDTVVAETADGAIAEHLRNPTTASERKEPYMNF